MLSEAELAILFRTTVAALLGFVIGWERMATGAPVRGRSITLATMTAAALTAVGVELYPTGAMRVVAGIVTGVGFLGAGLIVRGATGEVRGQATAAALWTMSSIGIIVGAGHIILGILLTLMTYVIMAWDEWPLVNRLSQRLARRKAKDDGSRRPSETDTKDRV
jgi:putative Mg2+ transporter-C (MgtC) family protein